jgi:S-(hydroxymethyl)glutathione dehydrogenase/alcohol dehydrogenase
LINSTTHDAWVELKNIFADQALDLFIDNTGNPEIIAKGYDLVSAKGRVLLVGVPAKSNTTALHTLPLHFGKTIVGTHGGETIPHIDIPRYMRLFEARKVDLNTLISEVRGLEQINQMIAKMRDGTSAGRCLVEFE